MSRDWFDARPSTVADIVPVDIVLPGILVSSAHEVETMVPDDDGVSCARSVNLPYLHVHALPGPQVLWHKRPRGVLSIAYGAAGTYTTAVPHRIIGGWRRTSWFCTNSTLTARKFRFRSEQDSIHVVQAPAVEAAQDVHVALVHNRFVERSRRRLHGCCANLCPMPVREVVLVQVWEAVLGLVHTAEREHGVATNYSSVAVTCPWRLSA
mmetsp:Transcript_46223/g.122528  ORF Transcript_46223/g.122528 Transcript_46223/m.122528 type:complete len:209 (-) Transcript_46223:763-1389(-)